MKVTLSWGVALKFDKKEIIGELHRMKIEDIGKLAPGLGIGTILSLIYSDDDFAFKMFIELRKRKRKTKKPIQLDLFERL